MYLENTHVYLEYTKVYLEYTKVHSSVRDLFDRVVYRFGISVGIGWYFLGILPTDTKGKLGWYILVLKIGGSLIIHTLKGGS